MRRAAFALLVAAALLTATPPAHAQPLGLDAVFTEVATEIIAFRTSHFATAYCVGVADGDETFRNPTRDQLLMIRHVVARRGHLSPTVLPRDECGERASDGTPREEGVFDLLLSWMPRSDSAGTVTLRIGPAIALACPVNRVDEEIVIETCREIDPPPGTGQFA